MTSSVVSQLLWNEVAAVVIMVPADILAQCIEMRQHAEAAKREGESLTAAQPQTMRSAETAAEPEAVVKKKEEESFREGESTEKVADAIRAALKGAEAEAAGEKEQVISGQQISYHRTGRMVLLALASTPVWFFWYRTLSQIVPGRDLGSVIVAVSIDKFLFTPVIYALGITVNAWMAGDSAVECLKQDFLITTAFGIMFWFPVKVLVFYFVEPTYWQVSTMLFEVVWIPLLSHLMNRNVKEGGRIEEKDDYHEQKKEQRGGETTKDGKEHEKPSSPKSRSSKKASVTCLRGWCF